MSAVTPRAQRSTSNTNNNRAGSKNARTPNAHISGAGNVPSGKGAVLAPAATAATSPGRKSMPMFDRTNSNPGSTATGKKKRPFESSSSLAKLEAELARMEGREIGQPEDAAPCLPPPTAAPAASASTARGPVPPSKPAPPPKNSSSARGSRFNRGSEQAMLERNLAMHAPHQHPSSATVVRRNSIGGGAVAPSSGSASCSATPTGGSRNSTPRRRESFNGLLAPMEGREEHSNNTNNISSNVNDDNASVISTSSSTAAAALFGNSPRGVSSSASSGITSKVDTGAAKNRNNKSGKTAEERMAALDRLARQVSKMERKEDVDDSVSSGQQQQQQQQQKSRHDLPEKAASPSWKTKDSVAAASDPSASASSSSPTPSPNRSKKAQPSSSSPQRPSASVSSSSYATEDSFMWPDATAEQNKIMSAPKGNMLERPGTGQYLFTFPKQGFFACRRCHCKIASAVNKVAAEGGYAAFSAYCVESLRCDIVVRHEMTTIAVACKSCLCNIGCLHPLQGHLMANSASLVHCPLERSGPEWEKPDTVFAEAMRSRPSSSMGPRSSPQKKNAAGADASGVEHEAEEEEEEEDSDSEIMKEADRNSVLFG